MAIAILAVSLAVLLEAQVSSLAFAGRARSLTIAALLARSKMIDIERDLADEGFTLGEQEESGDFGDETHPEITWKYKISEIELDMSSMGSMCGEDDESGCAGMVSGIGGAFEGMLTEIGKSVRVVALTVTWPDGKYTESMGVRAMLTAEDLSAPTPANPLAPPGSTSPGSTPPTTPPPFGSR
jgi:general secretion pathway protein I